MWEIREGYDHRMGRKEKSWSEAYECGYEDGYKDAMEEIEEMGERKGVSSYRMGDRRGRYR